MAESELLMPTTFVMPMSEKVVASGVPVPMLRKQAVERAGPKTVRTSFQSLEYVSKGHLDMSGLLLPSQGIISL